MIGYLSALMSGSGAAVLPCLLVGVMGRLSPSTDSLMPFLMACLRIKYEIQIVSASASTSTASSNISARAAITSRSFIRIWSIPPAADRSGMGDSFPLCANA